MRATLLAIVGVTVLSSGVLAQQTDGGAPSPLPPVGAETYRALKARAQRRVRHLAAPVPVPEVRVDELSIERDDFIGLEETTLSPPDVTIAKSFTRVLEGVNTALRLFDSSRRNTLAGGKSVLTKSLNDFFAPRDADLLFDPKVFFDENADRPRFYVVALQKKVVAGAVTDSKIFVAASRKTDPTSLDAVDWCRYTLDGRTTEAGGKQAWADYPGLGVGRDLLVISTNQFLFTPPATGSGFVGGVVRVLDKLKLSDNAAACPGVATLGLQVKRPLSTQAPVLDTFTMMPVQHYTTPPRTAAGANPVYVVNSVFPSTAVPKPNEYLVWRVVRDAGAIQLQGPLRKREQAYEMAPDAVQRDAQVKSCTCAPNGVNVADCGTGGVCTNGVCTAGAATRTACTTNASCNAAAARTCKTFNRLLDTGDIRIIQAAGIGNAIAAAHTVRCSGTGESCVRLVRLNVTNVAGGFTATFPEKSITYQRGAGLYAFRPGVAMNVSLQTMVPFEESSATQFLTSRWAVRDPSSQGFRFVGALTDLGACGRITPLSGRGGARTGDYLGVQTDPSDLSSFYLGGERAKLLAKGCGWSTQIIKVLPGLLN